MLFWVGYVDRKQIAQEQFPNSESVFPACLCRAIGDSVLQHMSLRTWGNELCVDICSCKIIHRGYGLLSMISKLVLCVFSK